jgi:NitT/TauT family transport system substrate-binding protein
MAALTIAGCGGSGSGGAGNSGSSGGLEKTHLDVGALAVADDAPLYIAIKNGYFFQAESKGVVSFKVLADATHCMPSTFDVMAMPGSGIKTPANLAGKSVAVNLTNNVQTLTLDTVLKNDGVNPSSVRYVEVPFPDMVTALKAHRVDAISAIEPYITGSEQQDGAAPVVSQCQGATAGFPLSGYFATKSWAEQNPNTAKAFQKALDKAQALADSDPAAVRQILPTYTKVTPATASVLKLNTYPATLSSSAMQQVASLMLSGGLLSKPLSVSSLMFP